MLFLEVNTTYVAESGTNHVVNLTGYNKLVNESKSKAVNLSLS